MKNNYWKAKRWKIAKFTYSMWIYNCDECGRDNFGKMMIAQARETTSGRVGSVHIAKNQIVKKKEGCHQW